MEAERRTGDSGYTWGTHRWICSHRNTGIWIVEGFLLPWNGKSSCPTLCLHPEPQQLVTLMSVGGICALHPTQSPLGEPLVNPAIPTQFRDSGDGSGDTGLTKNPAGGDSRVPSSGWGHLTNSRGFVLLFPSLQGRSHKPPAPAQPSLAPLAPSSPSLLFPSLHSPCKGGRLFIAQATAGEGEKLNQALKM